MSTGIVLTPAASFLDTRRYMHISDQFTAVKTDVQFGSACYFDMFNCCRAIPQFIDLNELDDPYKNDYFTFIFQLSFGYTMTATITNETSGVSNTITDNTYGSLSDLGFFPDRPLVWGFKTDWYKIYQEMGFGTYSFNFVIKNASGTTLEDKDSPCFKLMQWTCELAHGTIRIETLQTGYIYNGFDYQDLFTVTSTSSLPQLTKGWKQQIRWYGRS
jgi:hypothetical protein